MLDNLVASLIKEYDSKYDDVFGEGRGKLGYLIYKQLKCGISEFDTDLKLGIRNYFSKANRFLTTGYGRGLLGRIKDKLYRMNLTPRQFLRMATIGFLITNEIRLKRQEEVAAPYAYYGEISLAELERFRDVLETRGLYICIPDRKKFCNTARDKPISDLIEAFTKACNQKAVLAYSIYHDLDKGEPMLRARTDRFVNDFYDFLIKRKRKFQDDFKEYCKIAYAVWEGLQKESKIKIKPRTKLKKLGLKLLSSQTSLEKYDYDPFVPEKINIKKNIAYLIDLHAEINLSRDRSR